MAEFTDLKYDRCREWIRDHLSNHCSWDELMLACKADDAGLQKFLDLRKEEDFWPQELNVESWKEFVRTLQEDEKKRIQIQSANRMAELDDGKNENNRVYVPIGDQTSWKLYRKHLLEDSGFSEEAVQNIEDSSLVTLKRLSSDTTESGPVKGLVIGNVQSGKTANIAGIMAMAADWGFNMFIVLSGTIESLRKQTQNRLYRDLNHFGNLNWIQFDHLSKRKSPAGQRMCDLQLEDGGKMRYMTVCLKVKSRLEDLIDWIEADHQQIRNLRVLVIDDEADQASINTGDVNSENERKTINRLILNLINCRDKKATSRKTNSYDSHYKAMNYIGFTATPYANCLNETGLETLYPSSFIHTLNVSRSYMGPEQFFGTGDLDNDRKLDIVRTIPEEDINTIKELQENGGNELPESLKNSICWFLCAAAVMRFHGYRKPVSMLIHTSQKIESHNMMANAVGSWFRFERDHILYRCRGIYEEETTRFTKAMFREHYPDYEHPDEEVWDYPEFDCIEAYLEELTGETKSIMMNAEGDLQYCKGVHICIDNSDNNGTTDQGEYRRLAYPEGNGPGFATAFIVIGGNTLSRGLTLEGLVSTFFLRNSKQMDTLMQMGRWFGYRIHYELLSRVWLSEDTERKFELLTEVDRDLREQIYQMMLAGKGPLDFNLALRTSPNARWLSLTSKSKMQMAESAEMDFSGTDMQLTVYSKEKSVQEKNISVTEDFIASLGPEYRKSASNPGVYVWEGIPFDTIMSRFFGKGFTIAETSRAFQQMDLMEDWVSKQTEKGDLTKWNILLCGLNQKNIPAEKIWNIPCGINVGKVNRSCKTESEDHINIGVLTGKRDYIADITPEELKPEDWKDMLSCKSISTDYRKYRNKACVDHIPLFLIYMIDRNSKATGKDRKPLCMERDLIGIAMSVPGIRGSRKTVPRVKIRLPEDNGDNQGE